MARIYGVMVCFCILLSIEKVRAQPAPVLTATEYLDMQDYNRALTEFLKLYKDNPSDIGFNFNIGFCYLKINDDRSKSIPYLEFASKKDPLIKDIQLYLGQAYMYGYKFDVAISHFNTYRSKTSSKNYEMVDHLIEDCESAKVLMKSPLDVTFENLGKDVNSPFPDYYPFVTKDEGTLYFTSRREGNSRKNTSWQGYFTADIYFSKVKSGQWTKAKNMGTVINTAEDEECVSLTPDGKNMIIYFDNDNISGDLFQSTTNKNKTFQKPIGFNDPVNTDFLELEGCLADDGNILIISSDRKGGLGETDLWMFKKLPTGNWGLPINLGPNVNTKYKEAFPYYDDDKQVLYFASEGHTNMGGYDIFRSKFDPESQTFGSAENVGYPINTPEDNMEFTLAENDRDGYVSAVRKGGFGDLDIYKVVFNGVAERLTVVKGTISTNDTIKKDIVATVSLLDPKTKELIDSENANSKTGNFIFAVGPGKYLLVVSSDGYLDYSLGVNVFDKSDYIFEIDKKIVLLKPSEAIVPPSNQKPPPKNQAKPIPKSPAKPK